MTPPLTLTELEELEKYERIPRNTAVLSITRKELRTLFAMARDSLKYREALRYIMFDCPKEGETDVFQRYKDVAREAFVDE